MALILGLGSVCVAPQSFAQPSNAPIERVTQDEMTEIRQAFRAMGLRQADVTQANDGRVTLIGEYENRDEVETAFAAARGIVGLQRVAPTTPTNIKYRLKGFNTAFSSTISKMMQNKVSSTSSTAEAAAGSQAVSAAPTRDTPMTFALVIGANKHKYLPPSSALPGAESDAKTIYDMLTSPEGAGIPKDSVRMLVHERASSAEVRASMREIVQKAQKGDTVFLFVAAHGTPNAMNKFDVVLYDTEMPKSNVTIKGQTYESVIMNRKSALTDDDLQGFVAQLTTREVRVVMLLDTCYSGKTFVSIPGYLPSRTRSLARYKKEASYTTGPSEESITDLAQKAKDMNTSRIVIVSASENEESLEDPKLGGGAFTQTYIRSLRQIRDFADAFDQTKPTVIRLARTMGHSQTPRMLVVPENANTKM